MVSSIPFRRYSLPIVPRLSRLDVNRVVICAKEGGGFGGIMGFVDGTIEAYAVSVDG